MTRAPAARLRPLYHLTRARLAEIWREPGLIFWIFGFPVLMAVVLGMAFRSEPVERAPVAVLAGSSLADWGLEALERSDRFEARLLGVEAAAQALRLGHVDVVLEVESVPVAGNGDEEYRFSYRFDPTRPQSRTTRLLVDDTLQRAAGREDAASSREQHVTEPGSRYIDFLMPGLVGLNLMGSSMWGMGFAIVFMRARKILKRFAATPMRRSDFLLAMVLSRLVFLVLEVAFLIAFGWLAFGVAVRGSILALALISLLGGMSFGGLSLLIAARPRSIEVASGWMNFVMIPMWLCGGSFFSYSRFPEVLHPLIRALPLTALNDALRSIINEAAPIWESWPELLVLVAWGLVSFVLALRWFRWQ